MIPDKTAFNERRGTTRISCNGTAIVKGRDERGGMFEATARVINLSAKGVFMLVSRTMTAGDILQIRIPLPIGSPEGSASSQLQTDGTVVRVEPHGKDEFGIAVHFRRHRFVYQEGVRNWSNPEREQIKNAPGGCNRKGQESRRNVKPPLNQFQYILFPEKVNRILWLLQPRAEELAGNYHLI